MELDEQDKPNQCGREQQPANCRDYEAIAPAAQEEDDAEKEDAENQRNQGSVFRAF